MCALRKAVAIEGNGSSTYFTDDADSLSARFLHDIMHFTLCGFYSCSKVFKLLDLFVNSTPWHVASFR